MRRAYWTHATDEDVKDSFDPQTGSAPTGTTPTSPSKMHTYPVGDSTDFTKTMRQTTANLAYATPASRKHCASPRQRLDPPTTPSAPGTPFLEESNQVQRVEIISNMEAEDGQRRRRSWRPTFAITTKPTPQSSPTQRKASLTRRMLKS